MSLTFIKRIGVGLAIVFMLLIVGSIDVSAQSRRTNERERQRVEREQRRQRQDRNDRMTERRIDNSAYIMGYQQGVLAGEFDRRKNKYNQSNVYRGTGPYRNSGDPTEQDYVYRQGYLAGYNDGFYGRRRY
jgi:hypothetical protein